MPTGRRPSLAARRSALAALATLGASLLLPRGAFAGDQKYEVLSASVRATLASAVRDRSTFDWNDLDLRAWVRVMTPRVRTYFKDEETARNFLALASYEAKRSGLDPHMVLAVIEVESKFRKYAVSKAGARGYMQVMPFWTKELGEHNQSLFPERVNLRYGCVILRHYLDREKGNMGNALARYNGSLGRDEYPGKVFAAFRSRWALG